MKFNTSAGQISRVLIIVAVLVLVTIVVVYFVIKMTAGKRQQAQTVNNSAAETENAPPKLVLETTIGDVKFIFQSAKNLGNTIQGSTNTYSTPQTITTTERFIKVIIGAQNKGKSNVPLHAWDIGNIVDSDGRNFISINDKASFLVPKPNLCGAILKPEFDPVPCVKIYEVSKISKNLKIEVLFSAPGSTKKQKSLIDLEINE